MHYCKPCSGQLPLESTPHHTFSRCLERELERRKAREKKVRQLDGTTTTTQKQRPELGRRRRHVLRQWLSKKQRGRDRKQRQSDRKRKRLNVEEKRKSASASKRKRRNAKEQRWKRCNGNRRC